MDKLRNITAAEVHREDTDFLLNYYKKKVCCSLVATTSKVQYSTILTSLVLQYTLSARIPRLVCGFITGMHWRLVSR